MIMAGENSIKEVIAFPKNNQAYSPMDDSPSLVDEDQLKMLHIKLDMPEKEEES
jgi:aspartyl-tRNA synthetase